VRKERHRRILWRVRQLVALCTVQTRRVRLPFPHTFASGSEYNRLSHHRASDLERKLIDLEKGSHRVAVWTLPPSRHRTPSSTPTGRVDAWPSSNVRRFSQPHHKLSTQRNRPAPITPPTRLGCTANFNCPPSTQTLDHHLPTSQIWISARSLQ